MNPETRFSSMWVCAQQGSGKTNLLLHMIAHDLQSDCSIVVMDSKGELTDAIRKLSLGDRLIVFDPDQPFAINPFDVSKSDEIVSHLGYMLSSLIDANISTRQRTFFETLVEALFQFPNPSLPLVREIALKGPNAYPDQIRQLSQDLQNFFYLEWKSFEDTAKEMTWRLRGLFTRRLFREMLSANESRFDIGSAINSGKVVVIDNSQAKCTVEGSAFLGRLFVAQIWTAGTARALIPEHLKKPTYVYIDEAHLVIKKDPKIAAIIDDLRSQKIGLILAHQRSRQIEDTNVRSALENCAIKMVNVNPGEETDYFSKLLDIPRERMTKLPRGHFAADIRFEEASIMDVPKADLPFRIMTPAEEIAFKKDMQERYGVRKPDSLAEQEPTLKAAEPPPLSRRGRSQASPDQEEDLAAPAQGWKNKLE
jgi:type IV secretory pathway VirB4 component